MRGRLTNEEVDSQLPTLRSERDRIKAALDGCEEAPKVVSLHQAAVDDYLRNLDRLAELIGSDLSEGDTTIAEALRKVIERVTVMPTPAGTTPPIAVHGRIEALLDLPPFPADPLSRGELVAGAGLEPATSGL